MNTRLPAPLYGAKYKATSYALFSGLVVLATVSLLTLYSFIDYGLKRPEPVLDYFKKTESEYKAENIRLQAAVDSLTKIAKLVPALKKRAETPAKLRVSNIEPPVFAPYSEAAPVYGTPAHTKYLVKKIQAITAQRDSLITWISINF